ncbi:MAG: alpha/beta-type small acid-soluble spore protein [Ruminiclostridium sp.]|nr:alpha/beta-type small acid-soluble spore protein [Ruminiclostridium sp.]
MASKRSNNANLNNIKMQAANEVGVPLKDNGYNGDLTSRQAGSVGGQMVKTMVPKQRMGNRYYIPAGRGTYHTLFSRSYKEYRMLRKNVGVEVEYRVEVRV